MATVTFSAVPLGLSLNNLFNKVKARFLQASTDWQADSRMRKDIEELMEYSNQELNELGLSHSQIKTAVRAGQ